jgi:hypothetical protein
MDWVSRIREIGAFAWHRVKSLANWQHRIAQCPVNKFFWNKLPRVSLKLLILEFSRCEQVLLFRCGHVNNMDTLAPPFSVKPAQDNVEGYSMRCERRASGTLGAANVMDGNTRHGVALIDTVKYRTFIFLHGSPFDLILWSIIFSIRFTFDTALGLFLRNANAAHLKFYLPKRDSFVFFRQLKTCYSIAWCAQD